METNGQEETEKAVIKLENLGTVNKNKVSISINGKGTLVLFFSYETCISFTCNNPKEYLEGTIKNLWGTTTGKLLNECEPDKSKRLEEKEFKERLGKALKIIF